MNEDWIDITKKIPDILKVRILLKDGSEINCMYQSDGDFYWKGGGYEIFIAKRNVTHWKPALK